MMNGFSAWVSKSLVRCTSEAHLTRCCSLSCGQEVSFVLCLSERPNENTHPLRKAYLVGYLKWLNTFCKVIHQLEVQCEPRGLKGSSAEWIWKKHSMMVLKCRVQFVSPASTEHGSWNAVCILFLWQLVPPSWRYARFIPNVQFVNTYTCNSWSAL